jgi:tetratricopeptide (TPR) repeat protein
MVRLRSLGLGWLVSTLLLAGTAGANERSGRLVATGLAELEAGRLGAAHATFGEAVAADPADAQALFYRGLAAGRAGDFASAATDLAQAVERDPNLSQAGLELGYALYRLGRYEEASRWLAQAPDDTRFAGPASLFLGICRMQTGDAEGARRALEEAATKDPALQPRARYYLERIDEGFGVSETRPYEFYGMVGFDYDSNVGLAPSDDAIDQALGIGDQEDGRANLEVGGRYHAVRTDDLQVSLGYELFQSLHFDLTSFNIQDHRVAAQMAWQPRETFTVGVATRYDYYLRETDRFLQEILTAPWIRIPLGALGETDIYYRYRSRDYLENVFDDTLDGANHAAGLRHAYYFGARDRYVAAGYRFDREDINESAGDRFRYDGQEGQAEFGWTLPWQARAALAYAYRFENYTDGQSNGREDDQHGITVALYRAVGEYLMVRASYQGTINDSNQPVFEYDGHVGSLALEMRY